MSPDDDQGDGDGDDDDGDGEGNSYGDGDGDTPKSWWWKVARRSGMLHERHRKSSQI